MNREQCLQEAFNILKSAGERAAASVQNNAPNNVILLQLIDAQKDVQEAFNKAWKIVVNLPET